MSITIVETSFDQLIKNIQAPPSRARSASLQSYDGAQQGSNFTPSKQEIPQTDLRRPSNTPSQGSNSTASTNATRQANWRSRSRSGSVASSTSSGKLAYTGILRHAVQRPTGPSIIATQEETNDARPFPMARRVTGPQNRPGCILSTQSEVRPHVQGLTPDGLPVWWCQFDNMVVFDGMLKDGDTGDWIPMTRSSKGLPTSNKHGEEESVLLDLQCEHCKVVLGLKNWRYSTKVCRRGVCTGCKVRCRQEYFRMMKQGHSFNHFEKVTQQDKSKAPLLERVSSADITNTVLAPLLETIAKEQPAAALHVLDQPAAVSMVASAPAPSPVTAQESLEHKSVLQAPVIEKPAIGKLVPEESVVQKLIDDKLDVNKSAIEAPPVSEPETAVPEPVVAQPAEEEPAFVIKDLDAQEAQGSPNSTKTRSAPSISELYFKDNGEDQHVPVDPSPTEASGPGLAVALSPTHSAEDIGLAITIDESQAASPDRRSLTSQPELIQRDSVSGLTITLPEDCHQEMVPDTQHDTQAESPQSEHPQTPTFEFSEPGPIIEDILSPKFPENYNEEEEPFDISLMIRNLDTDEVTPVPAAH